MPQNTVPVAFTSVRFRNFKALGHFSVRLDRMNILVGANNSGKSTVLSAFRVLDAGLRRARARKPTLVQGRKGKQLGHVIVPDSIPISLENVHTNYADVDSTAEFRLSNGNTLTLRFPVDGGCFLIPETQGRLPRTTTSFKKAFPVTVGVVPVLGPLEHEEPIVQEKTVRREVATHRASRHFRNYWRYNSEGFEDFAQLVSDTWPGMEVLPPEKPNALSDYLVMFCRENHILRELYWAGFGFQVWCQLLTHISRADDDTILIVDEPEIYLHPDVQRQLLGILRDAGPDVLLATHSSEIMGEADPAEILLVDKDKRSAKRIRDVEGVQSALDSIGSVQNITLTQLARTRRVLFVEGKNDFKRIRRLARHIGATELATGIGVTPVESGGFSTWEKIEALAWGIEKTLGEPIKIGAIFDRDYRCQAEVDEIETKLENTLDFAHIHQRKEIENYLLVPEALQAAFDAALAERARRTGGAVPDADPIEVILDRVSAQFRKDALAQYISSRGDYYKSSGLDSSTITAQAMDVFEEKWARIDTRMEIVPGKDMLRAMREEVQHDYSVSLTDIRIIDAFAVNLIPDDMIALVKDLDGFRTA